jgi:hypothetical protein
MRPSSLRLRVNAELVELVLSLVELVLSLVELVLFNDILNTHHTCA